MHIKENISLKSLNTFGINVCAKSYFKAETKNDLLSYLKTNKNDSFFVLGGGSNILLTKDIDSVLHIDIKGIEIIEEAENHVLVSANAGENWHQFVLWCIAKDFGGIENLSLIPGNVGTSPIQNIGAYGVELKDVFHSCTATHIKTLEEKKFYVNDCNFGYRQSIFKSTLKGNYIITNVTFKLSKKNHILKTDYGAIKEQLKTNGIKTPSIKSISDAVIAIRESKLPDPKKIGNSGSFFKNPIISISKFNTLKENFSEIPAYPISKTEVKIPAGWLIEQTGFKGKRFGNYGVHKNQALVLVNYDDAAGNDIKELSILIQKTVKRIFDISIEAEVNIM